MKKLFIFFIIITFIVLSKPLAQVNTSVGNPPSDITFIGFTAGGFTSTPSAGQLDSDEWRIEGLSDGNGTWGGSHTTGDFARGPNDGAVSTGGIYAFDVGSGNITLGFQATAGDVTSGKLILRLVNTGSDPITQLDVSYKIIDYNDQNRANTLNFAYGEGSTEPGTFTTVSAMDFTTTEVASPSPIWITTNRSTTITGLNVAQDQFIYLVWETDDVSGSGSRDEIAIDDISFSNVLPVELSSFSAVIVNEGIKLNWVTETEVNNYGFEIEKTSPFPPPYQGGGGEAGGDWEMIGFVEGHGNSNSPKEYSFIDKNVTGGKYSYRLKQIDNDGKFEYSKVIEIDVGTPLQYELSQNYPNPFNPSTIIKFSIPEMGNVKLMVYNILGEVIATLINEVKEAGVHTINYFAPDVTSGIYFYKIEIYNFVAVKKMQLVK